MTTFDLADFSAATFKFSSESDKGSKHAAVEAYDQESDDMMAQLMKEQNKMTFSSSSSDNSGNNEKGKLLLQTLGMGNSRQQQQQPAAGRSDSQQPNGGIRVMSSQDQMYQLDTAKVQSIDAKGDDDNFLESLIEEDMTSFNVHSAARSQLALDSLKNDMQAPQSLFNADSFMSNSNMPAAPPALPEPEPEVVMVDEWYYKDPQQNLQVTHGANRSSSPLVLGLSPLPLLGFPVPLQCHLIPPSYHRLNNRVLSIPLRCAAGWSLATSRRCCPSS